MEVNNKIIGNVSSNNNRNNQPRRGTFAVIESDHPDSQPRLRAMPSNAGLIDETILSTPLPQASSTVDRNSMYVFSYSIIFLHHKS